MRERNIEAIRGIFEAFNRADASSIEALDYCDPEIEIQDYPGFIDAEWHHGHAGVRRWAAKIWEVVRVRVKPIEFIGAEDGRLVVSYDMVDMSFRCGIELPTMTGYAVFTMRDAKILRAAAYTTKAAALKAVGLSGGE